MNSKNRNIFLAAALSLAAVLVLVLIYVVWPESEEEKRAESERMEKELREEHGVTEFEDEEVDAVNAPINPRAIELAEAQDYRERARWPEFAYPIIEGNDPLANELTVGKSARRIKDNPYIMVHYLDQYHFRPDEPIVIHAYLLDSKNEKVPFNGIQVVLTERGVESKVFDSRDMKDDGGQADTAGDLIYTASLTLPKDRQGPEVSPHGYPVMIRATTPRGPMGAMQLAHVGWLNLKHTGKFSDRLVADAKGNHLEVAAEFNVEKWGNYHVQASVYAADGTAIGWAQNRLALAAGTHSIPLTFYGLMFCEKKIPGPYTLKNFAYSNVSEMPNVRSNMIQPGFATAAYPYTEFSCQGFGDPTFTKMAEDMEKAAAE